MDFSFSNTMIKGYFEGDDSYVPTSELVYLHEHPLINSSFLVEIEAMVLKTLMLIEKKNIKGEVIERFISITKELGEQLPELTATNSPQILATLRTLYRLCTGLLEQYNVK